MKEFNQHDTDSMVLADIRELLHIIAGAVTAQDNVVKEYAFARLSTFRRERMVDAPPVMTGDNRA